MRLWHKDLISVLPRKQLLGQWRECCLIAKNIAENGTPNHILVNRIMDYPLSHFYEYTREVWNEMHKRSYKCFLDNFEKYIDCSTTIINHNEMFKGWHNIRYLEQCFYNLEEKYDCKGISTEEWKTIVGTYYDIIGW